MSFGEKILIGCCLLLMVLGIVDNNTSWGNQWWERWTSTPGRYLIYQGEKIGYINGRSRLVIAPQFSDGVSYFKGDLTPMAADGVWGYADRDGHWIIPPRFLTAKKFQNGRAAVSMRGQAAPKFGFIDADGKMAIPAVYAEVGSFADGLAPAKSAGLWGYLNAVGRESIQFQFEEAQDFSEGLAAVKVNGLWGFIDPHGLFFINAQFHDAKAFHDGLAPVKVGVRWGYINTKGEWVVEPRFVSADVFSDGLAAVDDSGYIDREGRAVMAPRTFLHAGNFSEGLAAVQARGPNKYKVGKWGYIDREGRWVIKPRFEVARDFEGGLARVARDQNNTQRGYVRPNGKLVWDPADWEKSAAFKRILKTTGIVFLSGLAIYVIVVLRQRKRQYYFLQTIS